jgi:hypothetical protein
MHPVTAWYLAEAKHDDMLRELARPRLPRSERPERPERHGLLARVAAALHRSKPTPTTQAGVPAGCGLPMGCAA